MGAPTMAQPTMGAPGFAGGAPLSAAQQRLARVANVTGLTGSIQQRERRLAAAGLQPGGAAIPPPAGPSVHEGRMQALRTRFVEGPTSVAQARGAAELGTAGMDAQTRRYEADIQKGIQQLKNQGAVDVEKTKIGGELDALRAQGHDPLSAEGRQVYEDKMNLLLAGAMQDRNLARVKAIVEGWMEMKNEALKARTAPEATAPAGAVPSVPVPPEAGMEATQQAETPDIATGAPQGATIAPQDEQAYDWAKTHMNDPTQGIKAKGILNGLKQKYKWL